MLLIYCIYCANVQILTDNSRCYWYRHSKCHIFLNFDILPAVCYTRAVEPEPNWEMNQSTWSCSTLSVTVVWSIKLGPFTGLYNYAQGIKKLGFNLHDYNIYLSWVLLIRGQQASYFCSSIRVCSVWNQNTL